MEVLEQVSELIDPNRLIALTKRLCESVEPFGMATARGEAERAAIIAEFLEGDGVESHVADVVKDRPNLIATVPGVGTRSPLVLQGHLDSSTCCPDRWTYDPRVAWLKDGLLYGGGVTDMLGGLAAMVSAVGAASRMELAGDLILHATMHHDGTGLGSKYALASEGPTDGFGICGEPSDLAIHTGNGGVFKFEIQLHGRAAHVSRIDSGLDTIKPAMDLCTRLSDHVFGHQPHPRLPALPRLVIGEVHAGMDPSFVADRAVIRGDLRSVPGMTRLDVQQEITTIAHEVLPDEANFKIRILAMHQPFIGPTEGLLVEAITDVHKFVKGRAPRVTSELPGQAYVTDAADLTAAGLETVVYGVGDMDWGPDAHVKAQDLVDSAKVYLGVAAVLGR